MEKQQLIESSFKSRKKLIVDDDMRILYQQSGIKTLELNLSYNRLTSKGLDGFHQIQWSSLLILDLTGNSISTKGCKYLSKAGMNLLQQLSLTQNPIMSIGMLHLCKAQWKQLSMIVAAGCRISENIWTARGLWTSLIMVRLTLNNLTQAEIIKLLLLQTPLANAKIGFGLDEINQETLARKFESKFPSIRLTYD